MRICGTSSSVLSLNGYRLVSGNGVKAVRSCPLTPRDRITLYSTSTLLRLSACTPYTMMGGVPSLAGSTYRLLLAGSSSRRVTVLQCARS